MHIDLSKIEDGTKKLVKPFEFETDKDAIDTFTEIRREFSEPMGLRASWVVVELISDGAVEAQLPYPIEQLGNIRSLLYTRTLIGEKAAGGVA